MSLFDLFRQHDLERHDHIKIDHIKSRRDVEILVSSGAFREVEVHEASENWPDIGESIWTQDDRWRWEPGIPFVTPGVVTGIVGADWVEVLALNGPHGGEHLTVPRTSLEQRHTEVIENTKFDPQK